MTMIQKSEALHPHDAEAALLGGILLNSRTLDELFKNDLSRELFDHETHQIIFDAIHFLYEEDWDIDPLTVKYAILAYSDYEDSSVDSCYLFEIANNCPSDKHVLTYLGILKNGYVRRLLKNKEKDKKRNDSTT